MGPRRSPRLSTSETPVLSVLVPFALEDGAPAETPAYLANPAQKPQIVLTSSFTKNTAAAAEALKWALDKGFSVDLDVQTNLKDHDSEWEALEELFAKAIPHEADEAAPKPKGKIILCTSSLCIPADSNNTYSGTF